MIKDDLRAEMRAKRRALTSDEVRKKSDAIYESLFYLDCFKNAETVCTFISAFKEPDTIGIIKRLWSENKKVIVPVTDMETNTLFLSYIESAEDLHKGAYGISEPTVIKSAEKSDIDVFLVPGLAFDFGGARMGFGKGCYDRFLAKTDAVKIGLCYDFQLFEKIPSESHDVPMDFIITENEIIQIKQECTK